MFLQNIRYIGFLCVVTMLMYGVYCNPCLLWNSSLYRQEYCYKVSSTSLNWTDAKAQCQNDLPGAKLLEVDNDSVIEFLSFRFYLSGQEYWTGAVRRGSAITASTSGQVLGATRIALSTLGDCVYLTNYSSKSPAPVLTNGDCKAVKKYICQLYVGDPCAGVLPGADFSSQGNCYQLNNVLMYWSQAQERCSRQGGSVAELHTSESYYYIKSRMERIIFKEVYIPASSTVFLQDYNIYLNKVNSFKFYLSACTDVKIYLWVSNSTTSYPTLGGSRGEYIAIYLGMINSNTATAEYCISSSCTKLVNGSTGANITCSMAPSMVGLRRSPGLPMPEADTPYKW